MLCPWIQAFFIYKSQLVFHRFHHFVDLCSLRELLWILADGTCDCIVLEKLFKKLDLDTDWLYLYEQVARIDPSGETR